jgi:O-antigen ligase
MAIRWSDRILLTLAVLIASVLTGMLGVLIGEASLGKHGELYLWLLGLIGVAVSAYFLILRSSPNDLNIGRLYGAPALILIGATSLLVGGIGGVLPHQLAWGSLGILFGLLVLFRASLPPWLIIYAGIGIVLQADQASGSGPVLDIGLSAVGLLVMWLVATALSDDGGMMKLMRPFAIGYWAITVLGLFVYVTHFSIGSMSSDTVAMPWQGGLKSIFTSGNYVGYGFISTQTGREASFIVCAYYWVAWRYERRPLHGYLAMLAFVLFITGYGRVPLIGGILGLGIILLTNERGTRAWRVAVAAIVVVGLVISTGLISQFTNVSARGGAPTEQAATGHLSLWSQHLGLFLEHPLTGVGSNATAQQSAEARLEPIIHDPSPLTSEKLNARGSRGEGGWTGLVAQRGVVDGGIILALIALAVTYCFSPFPPSRNGKQDMTLARALLAALLIFCITDVAPFSVYTVTAYILGQVAMIAAVRTIRRVRPKLG